MAAMIYGKDESEIDPDERFIGKTTVLGAGYGMGAVKFQRQLQTMGKYVDLDTCKYIIKQYRQSNRFIASWWNHLNSVLFNILANRPMDSIDFADVLSVSSFTGIQLPNGLFLNYPDLRKETDGQFSYMTRYGRNRIYGGKVAENLCQAVARCIIGEQMLEIAKEFRVVLTVHDAVACVVPEALAEDAKAYIETCMSTSPKWAVGLPLSCESGMATTYGDC